MGKILKKKPLFKPTRKLLVRRRTDKDKIMNCTHFPAVNYNSNEKRERGTVKNIEMCLKENKVDLKTILSV